MTRLVSFVLLLLLVASVGIAQDAPSVSAPAPNAYQDPEAAPRPTMRPTRVARAPRIDGVLDEPEWRSAQVLTDFRQQLPNTGLPARFRTQGATGDR
jgi:hypothetical protein